MFFAFVTIVAIAFADVHPSHHKHNHGPMVKDWKVDPSLRSTRSSGDLLRLDNLEPMTVQQEVETMIERFRKLDDDELTVQFSMELSAVEAALAKKTSDKKLLLEITVVRAELCADLGFKHNTFEGCDGFMRQTCAQRSGKVSAENCTKFFSAESLALDARQPAAGPAAVVAAAPAAAGAEAPGPALYKVFATVARAWF